ncbi:hypothetical protein O181_038358 [Austropuccinia psidii MF-1]|uniref:Uncharacterized protein n=1 Tax=Austropuccinia psidii MF-1 TaxID=1389203 RepID=A0A9Q3DD66_9BASI|nr:hypothetical protein [Austropuccinia psidii MF-1]
MDDIQIFPKASELFKNLARIPVNRKAEPTLQPRTGRCWKLGSIQLCRKRRFTIFTPCPKTACNRKLTFGRNPDSDTVRKLATESLPKSRHLCLTDRSHGLYDAPTWSRSGVTNLAMNARCPELWLPMTDQISPIIDRCNQNSCWLDLGSDVDGRMLPDTGQEGKHPLERAPSHPWWCTLAILDMFMLLVSPSPKLRRSTKLRGLSLSLDTRIWSSRDKAEQSLIHCSCPSSAIPNDNEQKICGKKVKADLA